MSGEEVESAEQSELAERVGKVGSPRGSPVGRGAATSSVLTLCPPAPSPAPGVCLLQDQPKAQTQNHQGQSCASSSPSGHSSRGWRLCSRVAQRGPQGSCPGLWGENWGGPVPRPPRAGSGNGVMQKEERRGQPCSVAAAWCPVLGY